MWNRAKSMVQRKFYYFQFLIMVALLAAIGCSVGPNSNRATSGHLMEANESSVISAMNFYIKPAQEVYFKNDWDGDGIREYAKTLGGEIGLATAMEKTKGTSKFWDAIAKSESGHPNAIACNGYYFKLLLQQGEFASNGAKMYMEGKNLVHGWAILAYPKKYDETGKRTYLMDSTGNMFRADLGIDTGTMASAIDEFNPDEKIWCVWVP